MHPRLQFLRGLALLIAAGGVISCSVVDQYSGRAVVYNVEAERAQEQALLLNIVRAYLHRPMQFTTVSSITGSATVSSGVQYTTPVNVPFRPTTNGASIAPFPPVPSWTVSGSMSGGPTFTIPVLDTQEFYQGLLKPIPAQIWDLYIQNTYPRDLLFNLIVEKIVIRRLEKDVCDESNHERDCELVIQNYVGEDVEIDLFQIFSDYLLALGLTTEPGKKSDGLLKPAYNINLNLRGAPSLAGGSNTGETSGGDQTPKQYGLCFAPASTSDRACVLENSLCGITEKPSKQAPKAPFTGRSRNCGGSRLRNDANDELKAVQKQERGPDLPQSTKLAGIIMSDAVVRAMQDDLSKLDPWGRDFDLQKVRSSLNNFRRRPVLISLYTRSVEAIIYYLGEVSRRRLDPDFHASPRIIYYTNPARYAEYPEGRCVHVSNDSYVEPHGRRLCDPIFILEAGAVPGPDTFLSTEYEGVVYSVPSNGSATGAVLDIVKQALALLSSAKSLPQSNVISVVGQ